MADDPFALFDSWFAEASESEINDPEAMALATADDDGRPSVRMVLLKGHGPDGFVFYTNQRSRKGEELAANPHAALLFHWKPLRRQVRIEGPVTIVSVRGGGRLLCEPQPQIPRSERGRRTNPGRFRAERNSRTDMGSCATSSKARASRARRTGAASGHPGKLRILERPPAPAPRTPRLHACAGRWLDRRTALPVSEAGISPRSAHD